MNEQEDTQVGKQAGRWENKCVTARMCDSRQTSRYTRKLGKQAENQVCGSKQANITHGRRYNRKRAIKQVSEQVRREVSRQVSKQVNRQVSRQADKN